MSLNDYLKTSVIEIRTSVSGTLACRPYHPKFTWLSVLLSYFRIVVSLKDSKRQLSTMMKHRTHPYDGASLSSSSSSEASPPPRARTKTRERRRRTRLVQTRGMSMDSIPEEIGGRHPTAVSTSLMLPLLIMLATTAMLVGSPEQWTNLRLHRSLLTLTLEHVSQYPFDGFLEVNDILTQDKTMGFYWQIPRCGGTTLKHIMGTCLKRVQAARTAADYCDMNSNELSLCTTKLGTFINADPSDHLGIQRSDRMGLVRSGMADVVVSSRILHAATLFDQEHKGRLFTVLRDPVERAVSTFYYLQNAYWERHYRPEYKEMTVLDYAALPDTSNNWMTRWLTGKNAEPHLTLDDLAFAKELLRRKFLILLTDEMSTSVQRLMHYMGWEIDDADMDDARECLLAATGKKGGHNKNIHKTIDKESAEYEALRQINNLDIELYEYAKDLFVEQWSVLNRKGSPFDMEKINSLFVPGNRTKSKRTKHAKAGTASVALPTELVEMLAATELSKESAKEASTPAALSAALLPLGEKASRSQKSNIGASKTGDFTDGLTKTSLIEAEKHVTDNPQAGIVESQGNQSTPSLQEEKEGTSQVLNTSEEPQKTQEGSVRDISHPQTNLEQVTSTSRRVASDQNLEIVASSITLPHLSNDLEVKPPRDVQVPVAGEFTNMLTKDEPESAGGEQTKVMHADPSLQGKAQIEESVAINNIPHTDNNASPAQDQLPKQILQSKLRKR